MPLGSLSRSKKGFYVATPLVGSILFLTAALLAAMMATENDARIFTARMTDSQGRLQFIAEAIMADSYDVLLQNKLEVLTGGFLGSDYFNVNTQEASWKESMKSGLESAYINGLGETLGMDVQSYAEAYGNMPDVKGCSVVREGEYTSTPAAEDSPGDQAIMVKSYSYGERIKCEAKDPEGEVNVDISGRYYKVNLRVPVLYDIARWAIMTAKAAINSGTSGISEPIVKWEGQKWAIITKAENRPVDPADIKLEEIVGKWSELTNWLAGRVKDVVDNEAKNRNYFGVAMKEFEVKQQKEQEYTLNDFELACADDLPMDQQSYRNCMPFRVSVVLGKKECSDIGLEPPRTPSGQNPNPIYNLQSDSLVMKCGDGPCPRGFVDVMKDVLNPIGSACVDYYGYADSVYPVCKAWKAKPRAVVIKSVIEDDDKEYVHAGEGETVFKFKDDLPDVDTGRIKAMRLTCDSDNPDRDRQKAEDDVALYKSNVRILLQNLDVKAGAGKDQNSAIVRWIDKGSSLGQINDENLRDVYRGIYGPNVLPMPCLTGTMRPDEKCSSAENRDKPRVQIDINWDETRAGCVNRANDLCSALCHGSAAPANTETFCKGLFPGTGGNNGARGLLVCTGGSDCASTYVEITSMTFGVGGELE